MPKWAQSKVSVIHDGIDTDWACPNIMDAFDIGDGKVFTANDEIITFVNRTFEPYRGIHIFLSALEEVLAKRPNAQIILVGEDTPKVSYGASRSDGIGWLSALKTELRAAVDWDRVHAVGKVPHLTLRKILRISSAHVYLTYPFVLSWSLLEAMSCGALVIGSQTAPVEEVITHGYNGLLVPFGNSIELSKILIDVLENPSKYTSMKEAARKTIIQRFHLKECIKRQLSLIDAVASRSIADEEF